MYQNYNYYPQTQANPQVNQGYNPAYMRQAPSLKGRLVASLEEARATSIDFDGSIFYFPDIANKRIYTKQINMDGTATMNVYDLREMPIEKEESSVVVPSVDKFVTKEEFERALAQINEALKKPIAEPARPQLLDF